MKTILLKLAGPMQSWGTGSHFETRHTDFYPSKSAIIGLASASLGYKRDEDEKIARLNELGFGVRVDQAGQLIRDYHIARKYKPNGDLDKKKSYVTNRYYLSDAIFIVGLCHQDHDLIDEIERGLKNPYFQTYMGRRALAINYDFFLQNEEKSLIDSMKDLPWQARKWYKRDNSNKLDLYLDSTILGEEFNQRRRDKVVSFSQKGRRFQYRFESKINIVAEDKDINRDTEHDIFGFLGG